MVDNICGLPADTSCLKRVTAALDVWPLGLLCGWLDYLELATNPKRSFDSFRRSLKTFSGVKKNSSIIGVSVD